MKAISIPRLWLVAVSMHLVIAWFSEGYYHFDEHFQIIEFANYKLQNIEAKDLPWEFTYQMRSGFQPFIAYCVFKLALLVGVSNPFTLALLLRLVAVALSLFSVFYFQKNLSDDKKRLFLISSFGIWFIAYNHVRFSSEMVSASFLLLAYGVYVRHNNRFKYLWLVFLLGMAFLARFQTIFFSIAVVVHIFIYAKLKLHNYLQMFVGFAMVFGIALIADYWLYGQFTLSFWNYFDQNLLQNKVSGFGVEPWWYYLKETLIQPFPLIGVLILVLLSIFFFRNGKNVLTWSIILFLLVHFAIGHKEYRFLFPIMVFLPVILTYFDFKTAYENKLWFKKLIQLVIAVNFIYLIIILSSPADRFMGIYKVVYQNYEEGDTLFYNNINPYDRTMPLLFYKPKGLVIKQFNDTTYGKFDCAILKHQGSVQVTKLAYCNIPVFILNAQSKLKMSKLRPYKLYISR